MEICFQSVILSFLITVFSTSLFAQADSLRSENSAQRKTEAVMRKLDRELILTTDQEEQVMSLLVQRFEQFKTYGKNKEKRNNYDKQARLHLQRILNEEQFKKYQELRLDTKRHKALFREENLDYKTSEEDEELDF